MKGRRGLKGKVEKNTEEEVKEEKWEEREDYFEKKCIS